MLPGLTVPDSWRALLETFRPVFGRGRTFAVFALLATGLVAQAGRRTVVGMLAGAGMAAVVSFHAVCRFFSRHAWDADRIGLTLARLIVDRLLGADAAIDVVVDDTLIRRWGPKVFGAFWTHDGFRAGPERARPRQSVDYRGDRGAAAVLLAPGVPAGAVAVVGRQGHRLPGAAGRTADHVAGQRVSRPPHPHRRRRRLPR
jgi:hypothetical protein